MYSCRLRWQVNLMSAFTFLFLYYSLFFLKLIVACRLCVIYVREDDNSYVYVMITWFIWILWTLLSAVRKERLLKLNHSHTHRCTYVGKTPYTYTQYTSICYFLLQTELKACIGRGNFSALNNHLQPAMAHLRAAVWEARLWDAWIL